MLTRPDPPKSGKIVTRPGPTRPDPRVHPTRGQLWDLGYLFLIIIISASANICVVESTRFPYCNEDFVSLGRHTWRCRARRTLTAPVPTVDSTVNEDNINNGRPGNHSILPTVPQSQDNVAFIKCSCGRLCKGRRGLSAHHRSCAIHESLSKINDSDSDHCHHTDEVNHFDSADGSSYADPIIEFNIDMSENNEHMHAQYKPGIKLPKTCSDWAMANAYFQSIFDISSIPTNSGHFVEEAQNKIYDYFRSTYGSVETTMPRMIISQSITPNQSNLLNPFSRHSNHPKLNSKISDLLVKWYAQNWINLMWSMRESSWRKA